MVTHLECLAALFLENEAGGPGRCRTQLVPVVGICPHCSVEIKWGDLIKDMMGRVRALAAIGSGVMKRRTGRKPKENIPGGSDAMVEESIMPSTLAQSRSKPKERSGMTHDKVRTATKHVLASSTGLDVPDFERVMEVAKLAVTVSETGYSVQKKSKAKPVGGRDREADPVTLMPAGSKETQRSGTKQTKKHLTSSQLNETEELIGDVRELCVIDSDSDDSVEF